MQIIQVLLDEYNKLILVVPKDILVVCIIIVLLFLLLTIYELYKSRKSKNIRDYSSNEKELIKVEEKLKAIKELYEKGHINEKIYKEKSLSLMSDINFKD